MKTNIEWIDGVNFTANTESGNKIMMDGPVDSGGNNNGARPTELLISGMGGCTSFDIICMANTKNIKIKSFNLEVEAKRTETKPSLINKIHCSYRIESEEKNREDLEKFIKLSIEKQCSCCVILGKAVDITYSLEIY
jgi:putative redox protein